MMVRKPSGTYRFCIDFRKINAIVKKDAYSLPFLEARVEGLLHARYITSIDLKDAYYQVPLEGGSKEITAFSVPGKGHYQWRVLPYDLSDAPTHFQRLMDKLFGPEIESNV